MKGRLLSATTQEEQASESSKESRGRLGNGLCYRQQRGDGVDRLGVDIVSLEAIPGASGVVGIGAAEARPYFIRGIASRIDLSPETSCPNVCAVDNASVSTPELIEEWRVVNGLSAGLGTSKSYRGVAVEGVAPPIVHIGIVPGDRGRSVHCEHWDTCSAYAGATGNIRGAGAVTGTADRGDSLGHGAIRVDIKMRSPTRGGREGSVLLGLSSGEVVVERRVIGCRGGSSIRVECEAVLIPVCPSGASVRIDPAVGVEV